MMDLVRSLALLDDSWELHEVRLLILLAAFAGGDGSGRIEGLTKLAKLDFLLRYPVMLERALAAKKKSVKRVEIESHERTSVESEMVRYRFGPWDHRYRQALNIMAGKGLAAVTAEGRTVMIRLTEAGRDLAGRVGGQPEFEAYVRRAGVLKTHFDVTGSHLMRFIYETFPEILSLRSNEPIRL